MKTGFTIEQVSGQTEPITLSDAKAHLRVEHSTDDALITTLITAARLSAEAYCNRKFLQYEVQEFHQAPGRKVHLTFPHPTDVVVEYKGADDLYDALEVVTHYRFMPVLHAYIYLQPDKSWPTLLNTPDAMRISYTTGYTSTLLPKDIRQAMLLIIGDYYENRENRVRSSSASVTFAAESILDRHRIAPFDMIQ